MLQASRVQFSVFHKFHRTHLKLGSLQMNSESRLHLLTNQNRLDSVRFFLTANHNELASEEVHSTRNRDQIMSFYDHCNEILTSTIYS